MSEKTSAAPRTVWVPPNAVQIHVALDDIEPPIWRRLVVPLTTTLAEFHHILQAAMGWTDAHLHQFAIGGLCYGDLEILEQDRFPGDRQVFDASTVRFHDFEFRYDQGPTFVYEYDFGDDWRHTIMFETLLTVKPVPKTATCIDGARCCPPEDVGGPHSYSEFLRVLRSPGPDEIEEQRHLKRWSGGKFDPERFDLARTDKAVRGALRKRRRG